MTDIDVEPAAPRGMLLHGWKGIAQAAAMVLITVGAGFAIYAERGTVQKGLGVLPHLIVITIATLAYFRLRAHRIPVQS
jgi:hypothetical protein